MLYNLELPPETRTNLTNLTWVQFELLRYGASSKLLTTISKEMPKSEQDQLKKYLIAECSHYLEEQSSYCKTDGKAIAEKFFSSSFASKSGGITLLHAFAISSIEVNNREKEKWFAQREAEIQDLLNPNGTSCITIEAFNGNTKSCDQKEKWGKNAGKFLLYFYTTYIGTLSSHIPTEYLMTDAQEGFGRHDLIELFHQHNPELEICTMCDETKFYTRYLSKNTKNSGIKSHVILDHYLPKVDYPHLCCHPYNLVPVCYACNSPIKGEHNPLQGKGGSLQRAALPYHGINLSKQAYLKVALKHQHTTKLATIEGLAARRQPTEPYIQEAIDLLENIYKLPGRWSEEQQTTGIMHTLFRRIRHFLGDCKSSPLVSDEDEEIFVKLKQLLYYLEHDDQRKDPYAFAMTWILAAFLNEKKQDTYVWKGFVKEVKTGMAQNLERSQKRDRHVDDLLNLLQKTNSPTKEIHERAGKS